MQRAEPEDLQRLRERGALLVTAFEARDASAVAKGFQRWLDALVDAGHSVAVRWIANPFLEALRHTLDKLPMLWILEPSFPEHVREVVRAVEENDEERGVSATRRYYERVDAQLLGILKIGITPPQGQEPHE